MGMKHLALAIFVGFGLSACSGDDEQAEPIQAEEGGDSLADASAEGEGAPSPEGEAVADAELTVPAEGEAPKEGDFASAEGEAPPPGEGDETAAMYSEPPMPSDETAAALTDANAPSGSAAGGLEPEPELTPQGGGFVQSPGAKWNPSEPKNGSSSAGGKVGTYTVRPGDTLAGISQKLYGTPSNYTTLAEANGLKEPYLLFPGQTISYSGSSWSGDKGDAGVAAAPGANKTLTVRAGDTLWHLAEKYLGNAYAWRLFVDWNPSVLSNPNRIEPGMKLAYGSLHGATVSNKDVGNSGSTKSTKTSAHKKKKSVSGGSTAFKVSAPKSHPAAPAVKPVEPVAAPPKKEAKLEEPPKPIEEPAAAAPDDAPPVEETVGDEPPPPPAEEVFEEEEAE